MAKEGAQELQGKRDLSTAYSDLGKATFDLADKGELTHPELTALVDRIRTLREALARRRRSGRARGGRGADRLSSESAGRSNGVASDIERSEISARTSAPGESLRTHPSRRHARASRRTAVPKALRR